MHEAKKLPQHGKSTVYTLGLEDAALRAGVLTQVFRTHPITAHWPMPKLPLQIAANHAQGCVAGAGRKCAINPQETIIIDKPRLPSDSRRRIFETADKPEPLV
jgi:hypothetical protein